MPDEVQEPVVDNEPTTAPEVEEVVAEEVAEPTVDELDPVGDPPIALLDENLMRDILTQLRDLHRSLTATLEQNIADEEREHIAAAANIITEAATSVSAALGIK